MPAVARIGDSTIGVCVAHKSPITVGGTIVSGSGTTYADGISCARIGDQVLAGCGHISSIVSGSGTTHADGVPVARIGDATGGPYFSNIVSGSGSTYADG